MTKLFLLSIVLLMSTFINAQTAKPTMGGAEISDLKEVVSKYCIIGVYHLTKEWHVSVYADKDKLLFTDKTSGNEIYFFGLTEIFNFMDKSGWKYIEKLSVNMDGVDQLTYLFEKKEDKKSIIASQSKTTGK